MCRNPQAGNMDACVFLNWPHACMHVFAQSLDGGHWHPWGVVCMVHPRMPRVWLQTSSPLFSSRLLHQHAPPFSHTNVPDPNSNYMRECLPTFLHRCGRWRSQLQKLWAVLATQTHEDDESKAAAAATHTGPCNSKLLQHTCNTPASFLACCYSAPRLLVSMDLRPTILPRPLQLFWQTVSICRNSLHLNRTSVCMLPLMLSLPPHPPRAASHPCNARAREARGGNKPASKPATRKPASKTACSRLLPASCPRWSHVLCLTSPYCVLYRRR
jgi:hypothetical protein